MQGPETSPAPWRVSTEENGSIALRDANDRIIALILPSATQAADARLIADAPELPALLKAVQRAADLVYHPGAGGDPGAGGAYMLLARAYNKASHEDVFMV